MGSLGPMLSNVTYEIEGDNVTLSFDDRETQTKFILIALIGSNLGQSIEEDRLTELLDYVRTMDVHDLYSLHKQLNFCYGEKGSSDLQYYKSIKESLQTFAANQCEGNRMTHRVMCRFASGEMEAAMLQPLINTQPTDRICLDEDTLDELYCLWHGEDKQAMDSFVPADIFFAQQVCLYDTEIFLKKRVGDEIVEYESRIKVFDNGLNLMDNDASDNTIFWLGLLDIRIPRFQDVGFVYAFGVMKGLDVVLLDDTGVRYGFRDNDERFALFERTAKEYDMIRLCTKHLQTWYTIQMALLNPVTHDAMMESYRVKDRRKRTVGTKLSQVTRHIKLHQIKLESIKAAYQSHSFARRTMSWYVMGHWRRYKTGKLSFVSPYWKGPLRDLKMAEDIRTRIIDSDSIDEKGE